MLCLAFSRYSPFSFTLPLSLSWDQLGIKVGHIRNSRARCGETVEHGCPHGNADKAIPSLVLLSLTILLVFNSYHPSTFILPNLIEAVNS